MSIKFLIDLEAHFKVVISGDLIGYHTLLTRSLWGSGAALNIFRGILKELILARNISFVFNFLRELIFEKMAISNISHELKLANFAKY